MLFETQTLPRISQPATIAGKSALVVKDTHIITPTSTTRADLEKYVWKSWNEKTGYHGGWSWEVEIGTGAPITGTFTTGLGDDQERRSIENGIVEALEAIGIEVYGGHTVSITK